MDIEDNTDALRLRSALELLLAALASLLETLGEMIEKYADLPLMAFTHLQPAEPSTLGYRLAFYGQDLLEDFNAISAQRAAIHGKGFKGAVGTSAAYAELIGVEKLSEFELKLSARLDLPFFPVTSQVYPRKQDYNVVSTLAGLGASLYKFAIDLRLLQSPLLGEWSEPFGEKQVGSSAMPFKRNPIRAEKINSLARYLAALPRIAWDNAAHSLLERTLDDSANRRTALPEAFLCADELLMTAQRLIKGLVIDETSIARNFAVYAPFAATERLLMAAVKAGADRQELHEVIREHSMQAWAEVKAGRANPLIDALCADERITRHLDPQTAHSLLDARDYVGDAPQRARWIAKKIRGLPTRVCA